MKLFPVSFPATLLKGQSPASGQITLINSHLVRPLQSSRGSEKKAKELLQSLGTIENGLAKLFKEEKGPFFGGKHMTLADIALAPIVAAMEAYQKVGDFRLPDAAQCPYFFKWIEAVKSSVMASALPDSGKVKDVCVAFHDSLFLSSQQRQGS